MALIIITKINGTVKLTPGNNPVTILGTGGVSATAAGADAIDGGSGVNWSITNSGSVSSTYAWGINLLGAATIANYGKISGYGGIDLQAGGTVNNYRGGTISGTGKSGTGLLNESGVYITGAKGNVTNSGNITAGAGYGVGFGASGTVTNTGTITGGEDGVIVVSGSGSVTNSGSITATIDDGVALFQGGGVTNNQGATINATVGATAAGVWITGASGTVKNSGTINGLNTGVSLYAGGTITNNATGTITGQHFGIDVKTGGTVFNYGQISSTLDACGFFEAGGAITNYSGAKISGLYGIFFAQSGVGTVVNSGSIVGNTYSGVQLGGGGSVTNNQGGSIQGQNTGVALVNVAATLANSGAISANAAGASGVSLYAGGQVTNNSTGTITGVESGIFATGAAATAGNSGQIQGRDAIEFVAGGVVNNLAGGSLTGQNAGAFVTGGTATITNSGTITATASGGAGLDLEGGGSVTNNAGATISGGWGGVFITGGAGVVNNFGTITGGSYAVDFSTNSSANRVIDNSGAVFNGLVNGDGGTLELAIGSGGSFAGLGTNNFQGFQNLQIDSGGAWTITGAGNAIANVTDNGSLAVAGSLQVTGALDPASAGGFRLGVGDSLEIAQALGANSTIDFQNSGDLILDSAANFGTGVGTSLYKGDQLQNFGPGSLVDLLSFSSAGASVSYDSASGLLQITNAANQTATLAFQTSTVGSGAFQIASDGGSGVKVFLG